MEGKTIPGFTFTTGRALANTTFPPLEFLVDGLIPLGGACILAAPPKAGKSFLAQDLVISVALGRPFLGRTVKQGISLYLALEDGERRLQARQSHILAGDPATDDFQYVTAAARINDGLQEQIEGWKEAFPSGVLVVIDIFQRVRPEINGKLDPYQVDYEAVAPLNDLARKLNLCILLVHHTRKSRDPEDMFANIHGSQGIFGAVSSAYILDRKDGELDAELFSVGKDIEGETVRMRFNRVNFRFETMADIKKLVRESPNPLARVIVRMLGNGTEWTGSMTDFANYANQQAEYTGKPIVPSGLGRMLKANDKTRSALLAEGVDFVSDQKTVRFYRVN